MTLLQELEATTARPVGVIANPVSGKDIRRLIANASTSTLHEKRAIVRRVVIGAAEAGATEFLFLPDPHRICDQAVERLGRPALSFDHVELNHSYDEHDTIAAAAAMRDAGCAAVVILGGDGTNRAAALGWRDIPVVPISTGTNNVFPVALEATVAGSAAGLIASGVVDVADVTRQAKLIDVEVEEEGGDLALIDAVLVAERFVGSRALFDPDALRTTVLSRAEPTTVGVCSIGGLLAPTSDADDAGVTLELAPPAGAPRRIRAPIAPGLYADIGVESCRELELGEPVTITGPGILAFDGERQRMLDDGQTAILRVTRDGPRVIDSAATQLAAVAAGAFQDPI